MVNTIAINKRLERFHEMVSKEEVFLQTAFDRASLTPAEQEAAKPVLSAHFQRIAQIHQTQRAAFRQEMNLFRSELLEVLPDEKVKKMGRLFRLRQRKHKRGKPHGPPPPNH